jgi:hypothetical protein
MIGVKEKISQIIKYRKRGSIFFSADFVTKGSLASVNKALSELTKSGVIVRLASGIYCRPMIDDAFGLGVIYPGIEEIAEAVAARDGARIIPTGAYAQNRLGLSTQIPMNAVFLTDGSPRRIKVYNGKGILFKRAAPRVFKFKSPLAMMLTLALKDIGERSLTAEQKSIVKYLILNESKELFIPDYPLMPEWIRLLIEKTYEENNITIV